MTANRPPKPRPVGRIHAYDGQSFSTDTHDGRWHIYLKVAKGRASGTIYPKYSDGSNGAAFREFSANVSELIMGPYTYHGLNLSIDKRVHWIRIPPVASDLAIAQTLTDYEGKSFVVNHQGCTVSFIVYKNRAVGTVQRPGLEKQHFNVAIRSLVHRAGGFTLNVHGYKSVWITLPPLSDLE